MLAVRGMRRLNRTYKKGGNTLKRPNRSSNDLHQQHSLLGGCRLLFHEATRVI
jgi:hypothetical protein